MYDDFEHRDCKEQEPHHECFCFQSPPCGNCESCPSFDDDYWKEQKEENRSHRDCWDGEKYVHTCQVPSGRACVECARPAGTHWGPHFCPDCDVVRLTRISNNLNEIRNQFNV